MTTNTVGGRCQHLFHWLPHAYPFVSLDSSRYSHSPELVTGRVSCSEVTKHEARFDALSSTSELHSRTPVQVLWICCSFSQWILQFQSEELRVPTSSTRSHPPGNVPVLLLTSRDRCLIPARRVRYGSTPTHLPSSEGRVKPFLPHASTLLPTGKTAMSRSRPISIPGPSSPDFDGDDEDEGALEQQDQTGSQSPDRQLARENACSPEPAAYASEEEDEGSDTDSVHRWGDKRDTATSVRPYQALLASLEQEHHLSLSQHLHSAHLINRQQRSASTPYEQPNKRRKLAGGSGAKEGHITGPFITPHWTAWPLPPETVPREADHTYATVGLFQSGPRKYYHDDKATYAEKDRREPEPSQMLESTLMAAFLRTSKEKIGSKKQEGLKPSVDDELSESMLKPVVRNIISKLDGLLIGLYFEREPYVRSMMKTLSSKVGDGSNLDRQSTPDTAKERKVKKNDTPGILKREGVEREIETPGHGRSSEMPHRGRRRPSHSSPAASKLNAEKRMLAVKNRDWSQVLGVAAFTGFTQASLNRTTQRCESLFEETMSWRRLREYDPISDHAGEVWTGGRKPKPGIGGFNPNRPFIAQDGFMQELVDVGGRKGRKSRSRSKEE